MQSTQARIAVAIGSIAVIVVLFIVFSGGDDDESTTTQAEITTTTTKSGTEDAKAEQPDDEQQSPGVPVIKVVDGQPVDGVVDLQFTKGEDVAFEVDSDVDEEVHVHGYDNAYDLVAGKPLKISFPADIDGVFEVELEDSGVQLAQLTVNP